MSLALLVLFLGSIAILGLGLVVAVIAITRSPKSHPHDDLVRAGDEPAPVAHRNHGGTTGLNY